MSSELELTWYGRQKLAQAISAERAKPIVETVQSRISYLPEVEAVLANEERRLKLAARRAQW